MWDMKKTRTCIAICIVQMYFHSGRGGVDSIPVSYAYILMFLKASGAVPPAVGGQEDLAREATFFFADCFALGGASACG